MTRRFMSSFRSFTAASLRDHSSLVMFRRDDDCRSLGGVSLPGCSARSGRGGGGQQATKGVTFMRHQREGVHFVPRLCPCRRAIDANVNQDQLLVNPSLLH